MVPYTPTVRNCSVGDTVHHEGGVYTVTEQGNGYVKLVDTGTAK